MKKKLSQLVLFGISIYFEILFDPLFFVANWQICFSVQTSTRYCKQTHIRSTNFFCVDQDMPGLYLSYFFAQFEGGHLLFVVGVFLSLLNLVVCCVLVAKFRSRRDERTNNIARRRMDSKEEDNFTSANALVQTTNTEGQKWAHLNFVNGKFVDKVNALNFRLPLTRSIPNLSECMHDLTDVGVTVGQCARQLRQGFYDQESLQHQQQPAPHLPPSLSRSWSLDPFVVAAPRQGPDTIVMENGSGGCQWTSKRADKIGSRSVSNVQPESFFTSIVIQSMRKKLAKWNVE